MADGDSSTSSGPQPCLPCRGTGQVISNLGGSPSSVTCPWCEGGGVLLADHNAQPARAAPDPGTTAP